MFIDQALEHFSMVWVELSLAILVTIAYFVLQNGAPKVGSKTPASPLAGVKTPRDTRKTAGSDSAQPTTSQLASRALKLGKLNESIGLILQLPELVGGSVPPNFAVRLLAAASTVQRLDDILPNLLKLKGKISAGPLETVTTDAIKNKEFSACRQLHTIATELAIPKNQHTFEMFASAYLSDAAALRALVEEAHVAAFRTALPSAFARIVLDGCIVMKDKDLIHEVLSKVSSADAAQLRKVLEQVMKQPSKAPKASLATSDSAQEGSCMSSLQIEAAEAAAAATAKETNIVALRANDIRSCGRNGDLKGAIKVFERLGERSENVLIVNSILDACVACKDLKQAFEYFDRIRTDKTADVVSYNTMMKGCIANGQEVKAKELLAELLDTNMTPTRASFHGLLNARVNAKDFTGAWRLVRDMQASGVSPNAVTCSILLKGRPTSAQEVARILALIDAMEEPMDEVLFLAVVEACIRTGRLDALSRQMGKFMKQSSASALTAPTYGSMIKAYGHARDLTRVWELWERMIEHKVAPTSITLGCMVEALVANGCTSDAWKLIQKLSKDDSTRHLINTVSYSSLLKGFANAQDTEKVMALYQEMKASGIQPNTITFNTILNAFAKGGAMHRVPALLEDMGKASPPVELDVVSYSTIVKGYCNSGNLDRALKVVQTMQARGKHTPDEVMFNSLLGGCAKEHRPDEALQVLSSMRKFGVAPSNYTLSMLVKLMGRCRRINQAFTMLDDISQEYGLKVNIQVYTCLIQGCFNCGQAQKAIALHDKVIQEGLSPDSMTYTVLVRGCVQAGVIDQAVYLAKYAHGIAPGQPSRSACPGLNAGCLDELMESISGSQDAQSKKLLAELEGCKIHGASSSADQQSSLPWRKRRDRTSD
jgi:pentatricopeptide repeat protein